MTKRTKQGICRPERKCVPGRYYFLGGGRSDRRQFYRCGRPAKSGSPADRGDRCHLHNMHRLFISRLLCILCRFRPSYGTPSGKCKFSGCICVQIENKAGNAPFLCVPALFCVGAWCRLQDCRDFRYKLLDKVKTSGLSGALGIDNAIEFIFRLQIKPKLRRCPEKTA